MKARIDTKNKSSAKKKLIPAAGSLLISAAMLSTSTYAWFTMSREVEVTGINMTATVPEDLQISLGDQDETTPTLLKYKAGGAGDYITTANTNAVLANYVKTPTTDKNTNDWHNSVAFSDFYVGATLTPASSTDGNYLFKTADATSRGETVSETALFELVDVASTARNDMASLYINSTSDNATIATNVADRDNGGYYVDFPVWFRTSATQDSESVVSTISGSKYLSLGVKATITQKTGTEAEEDLYHAVRIAVLPATANDDAGIAKTDGTITGVIHDGYVGSKTSKYYDRYTATTAEAAIGTDQALYAPGTLVYDPSTKKQTNAGNLYGIADVVSQAKDANGVIDATKGEAVVQVPVATDEKSYGTPVKYIIRVWLEGEDQFCWNPTAGQDFNVSLNFVKLDSAATSTHDAPTGSQASQTTAGTVVASTSVKTNATSITVKANGANIGTYTVATSEGAISVTGSAVDDYLDSTARTDDDPAGTGNYTYTLADGTVIGNSTDLKNYIKANNAKYDLSTIDLGNGVVS